MGGRHTGGIKGYKFFKFNCPGCDRRIAVSFQPDGKNVWFRPHNQAGSTERCTVHSYDRVTLELADKGDHKEGE